MTRSSNDLSFGRVGARRLRKERVRPPVIAVRNTATCLVAGISLAAKYNRTYSTYAATDSVAGSNSESFNVGGYCGFRDLRLAA